jgi:hypothetical protein
MALNGTQRYSHLRLPTENWNILLINISYTKLYAGILELAANTHLRVLSIGKISMGQDNRDIVDNFMSIKDRVKLDELRFY